MFKDLEMFDDIIEDTIPKKKVTKVKNKNPQWPALSKGKKNDKIQNEGRRHKGSSNISDSSVQLKMQVLFKTQQKCERGNTII